MGLGFPSVIVYSFKSQGPERLIKISIIIPVKNGEATIKSCLQKIHSQTIAQELEIIVLDSMSTDKSRNIALSYGAKIIDIPNGSFNHGLTRNKGVEVSNGDLIYFTVQDAYLVEDDQLEKMSAHFEDEEVQSVTGIQGIPSDKDKNPAIWFKRFSKPIPEVRQFTHNSFQSLSVKQKLENSRWDDVNSMYRKSALQILRFRETDFAEDILWGYDALSRGWKLIRDSSLVVYHYHHQTFKYAFKSSYIVNYTLWEHFKIVPVLPAVVKPFAQNIYTLFKRQKLTLFQKLRWTGHNFLRLSAVLLSTIIFRFIFFVGHKTLLDKSFNFFCSNVPQGFQNETNKRH